MIARAHTSAGEHHHLYQQARPHTPPSAPWMGADWGRGRVRGAPFPARALKTLKTPRAQGATHHASVLTRGDPPP